MNIINEILPCSVCACASPSLGHTDQMLFLFQRCLQYCYIPLLLLTDFSQAENETMHPLPLAL